MANEYIRKEFDGGVVRTTTSGTIAAGATTITLTDGSTFPATNFVIVIDRGLATEEKVLVASRSTNTLTVTQRGYDGSTGIEHSSGAYVEHVVDAYVIDQANAMSTTMTTAGDMIYKTTTGENTAFSRLAVGTSEYVVKSNGSVPTYGQVQTAGLADNAVTAAKIASAVAGSGLTGGGGSALAVNVAAAGGLEVAADELQIKALGVTESMLAANAVTTGKIANGTIANTDISASAAIDISKINATNGITTAMLQEDSVTIDKIAPDAVGYEEIVAGAIVEQHLSTADGEPAGAWVSFTILNNALFTNVTSGDISGTYRKIGKTLDIRFEFTSGTVTANGNIRAPLPFNAHGGFPQGMHAWNSATPLSARTVQGSAEVIIYGDSSGGNFTNGTSLTNVRVNGTIELS